ncbi:MAG: glucose-6-phosphate isomerase [Stagnimonas sp.]|nr:glucose-6-phosphate isomerase [Stagnimonas sp.]
MSALPKSRAWRALAAHARELADVHLNDLFAADEGRAPSFSIEAVGLFLDYSKQRLTRETRDLLLGYAQQQELTGWIAKLFAGEAINHTEGRAAYHMALRAPRDAVMKVDGKNVVPQVHEVLDRMTVFAENLRSGKWKGAKRKPITDVVNIGIGGSDLGPRMVAEALQPFADGPRTHFVANVDGAQLQAVLEQCTPATTLFIITSKTFTTQETMANAAAARSWLVAALGEKAIAKHFAAVSTNLAAVQAFGIAPQNIFGFWDWVGGRYSMWSAVGLSLMVALGPERFRELLAGAHAMDSHFQNAPPEANLPVLLALVAFWNTNFLGATDQVIAPYAQRLEKFVAWLQQLEMESNGKRVNRAGEALDYATTPTLWGDVGTNGQHAFFQMLHQGTAAHPVDFVLIAKPDHPHAELNQLLLANCLAQSKAMMRGKTAAEVRTELSAKGLSGAALEAAIPHRVFLGNRPSNTLLMPQLDAWHLGALCALYEHRTFVLSVLWDVNAYDQWGVELGKQLAGTVLKAIQGERVKLDSSTQQLLSRLADKA